MACPSIYADRSIVRKLPSSMKQKKKKKAFFPPIVESTALTAGKRITHFTGCLSIASFSSQKTVF